MPSKVMETDEIGECLTRLEEGEMTFAMGTAIKLK